MKFISPVFLKLTFIILLFSAISNNASATHYAGTDLYYEFIGTGQYRITLVFYRDCSGVQEPTSADIALTNMCNGSNSVYTISKKINTASFTNGEEITSSCSSVVSACNGGTVPGLRKWVYEGSISLPQSTCIDWKVSYQLCCRNFAITTLQNPGGESLYTETVFKSNLVDNAPQFSNNPIAFACANQPFNFNQGAYDSDGDSIVYELDNPLSAGGAPVGFAAGYSKNNPFSSSNGFNLDAVSGAVSFIPDAIQVGVFAIKVKQYRNGYLLGYVRRDMEIFVTNCNANTLPVASGFDGTTNYSLSVCADAQLCTSVYTNDADAGQNISLSWNQGIANATLAITAASHPTANICWTPTVADVAGNPHVFTLTIKDDACPTNGAQTFSYIINVVANPVINISKTNVSCNSNSGSASVNQITGATYLWSNGCTTATATGLIVGTYSVTVTNAASCSSSASVQINTVAASVSISGITAPDNGTCNGSIILSVNSGVAPYIFNWSNGSSAANFLNLCLGTYTVTVADANGCTAVNSFTIVSSKVTCKVSLSLKSNPAGQCLQGGIITGVTNGTNGKCTAVLFNSIGIMIAQKNFQKTLAFDALYQGTYTVTVTDANGCSVSAIATVNAGGCGAPVNVEVINITANSAKVTWINCGAVSHVVRYKVDGTNNSFTYVTVNNLNEVVLPNLQPNTIYSVRIKSLCMQGQQSQYTIAKKFCTGGCSVPKMREETDILDGENDNYLNVFALLPNPAKDIIHLTGVSSIERTSQVVITNLLGKVMSVQHFEIADNFDLMVDVNFLPQGVYIITINGFENNSKRFIKM